MAHLFIVNLQTFRHIRSLKIEINASLAVKANTQTPNESHNVYAKLMGSNLMA